MKKRFQTVISNIGVAKTIEYITIAISLFSSVAALIQGHIFFFYIASLFTFLSFAILLYFLRCANNKEHTLHMLVQDGYIKTLFLLLTYDYFRTSIPEVGRGFSHSKLQASTAVYSYKSLLSEKNKNLYDLDCTFQFDLKQTRQQQQEGFDILILQPQGEQASHIIYKFDEGEIEYRTRATPIAINGGATPGFDGLLRAQLNLPEHFKKLIVTFCLRQVDTVKKEAPIIICPFIYVDTLDNLTVSLDYSAVPVEERPDQISIQMVPYDGSCGITKKISDFGFTDQRDYWELTLSKKKCRAHAIYIVDTHHPMITE